MSQYLENCRAWQKKAADGRAMVSFGFTNQLIDKVAELENKLEVYSCDNDRLERTIKANNQEFVDAWVGLQMKNMWLASRPMSESDRQKAESWDDVVRTLNAITPGWNQPDGSSCGNACNTIKDLVARAAADNIKKTLQDLKDNSKDPSISKCVNISGVADITIRVHRHTDEPDRVACMRLDGDLSDSKHLAHEIDEAIERYMRHILYRDGLAQRKDIHVVNINIDEKTVLLQLKPKGKSKEQIMEDMLKVLDKANVHKELVEATRR